MKTTFRSFAEFYPFYLSQHQNPTCRKLHLVGTTLALAGTAAIVASGQLYLLPLPLLVGYAFAWIGHFVFEKNRPATFQHPFYSFIGDFYMARDLITGRLAG
jgi:hypothetical protein